MYHGPQPTGATEVINWVILEVAAHTREIIYDRDSEFLKKYLGADTRQL